MPTDTQAFQAAAIELLKTLCQDERLEFTQAMTYASSNWAPSLGSILRTLDTHRENERVVAFSEERAELIEQIKKLTTSKQSKLAPADRYVGDFVSTSEEQDVFRTARQPFDLLKKHALSDIEEALSVALSKFCDVDFAVNIQSFTKPHGCDQANIQITVSVPSEEIIF